ncbi:MAG TPA: VOC family protein [Acidimicrobiales bacterium]|nr:VOC family protein [Acidimicrobiales bacterium]
MTQPRVVVSSLVVDCHDPDTLAAFWYGLLGGELMVWPQYGVVTLRAEGITIDFVLVPDKKVVKNRLHLDIASTDPESAIERVVELGGTFADDFDLAERFTVMRDVEGNEFCVMHDMPADRPWQPR